MPCPIPCTCKFCKGCLRLCHRSFADKPARRSFEAVGCCYTCDWRSKYPTDVAAHLYEFQLEIWISHTWSVAWSIDKLSWFGSPKWWCHWVYCFAKLLCSNLWVEICVDGMVVDRAKGAKVTYVTTQLLKGILCRSSCQSCTITRRCNTLTHAMTWGSIERIFTLA